MIFLYLFLYSIFALQITINPLKTLVFFEPAVKNEIFKLFYKSTHPVNVKIEDPDNKIILKSLEKTGTYYTKAIADGKFKITVKNLSIMPSNFNFRCLDANKELIGHLGYVKDNDLVGDLANLLDDLIVGQKEFIIRTAAHEQMVKNSRFWTQTLSFFEFILTAVVVMFIYKDFVKIFEQKRSI